MVLIAALSTAFAFSACNLFGENNNDNGDTATAVPESHTTPESNTTPGGSKTPDGSTAPGGSTTPGGSTAPGGSKTPGGSTAPGGSKTPDGSTAHVCSFVFKEAVKSCTEPCYDVYECSCGKTEKRNITSPAGHDYKWTIYPATCTTDWWQKGVCNRCGDKKTETVENSKRHTYGEYVSNNDATCIKDGTKTAHCLNCGEVNTITDLGTATGMHNYGVYKSNNDATCVKDGTKTAYCSRCGEPDTVTDKGTATGVHIYGEYKSNNDGNCQKDNTATAKCETCGATDTKTLTGSKGDHAYKWTTIEETCTTENQEGVCTVCGQITLSCIIYYDAWGRHDFNWTETHNATCTVDGYRKGTCKKCGMGHTEFLKATGHKAGSNNKCTVCGENVGQFTKTVSASISTASDKLSFGSVQLEFVLINPNYSGSGASAARMQYELYVVQSYYYKDKLNTVREKVNLSSADGMGGISMYLHRQSDNAVVKIEGTADYSVIRDSRRIIFKIWGSGTVGGVSYQFNVNEDFNY